MKTVKEALDFLEAQVKEQTRAQDEAQVSAAFVVARVVLETQERQAAALENIAKALNELTKPEINGEESPLAIDGANVVNSAEA